MHLRRRASGIVTIGVGPSLERQAPEVIPYWEGHWEVERQDVIPYRGGWASGGCIRPRWSRFREPITCHDITIAFPLGRELRRACSRWYHTLEVVGTEVERELHWQAFDWAADGWKNLLPIRGRQGENQPLESMKNLLTPWELRRKTGRPMRTS